MGNSLLKIYDISKILQILLVPDSFSLHFVLFDIASFLSLPLWIYTDRVSAKYRPKPRRFLIVHLEILLMKIVMPALAPLF